MQISHDYRLNEKTHGHTKIMNAHVKLKSDLLLLQVLEGSHGSQMSVHMGYRLDLS
jgi:hypothetical protein